MPDHDILPMEQGQTVTCNRKYWDELHLELTRLKAVIRSMTHLLGIQRLPLQKQSNHGKAEKLENAARDRQVDSALEALDELIAMGTAAINAELPSPDPSERSSSG